MHSDLEELGWTDEHMSRIDAAVSEEAQKARIAAQVLSLVGPLDPTTVATPTFGLSSEANPGLWPRSTAPRRLSVDTDPTLFLTRIAVNVSVRLRDASDPNLEAVLTQFRRAANYVARIEDALVFSGRPGEDLPPPVGLAGIPQVYSVIGASVNEGLINFNTPPGRRSYFFTPRAGRPTPNGNEVINTIIASINALDGQGQLGPYACVLSPSLFAAICSPTDNLVLPRDRILPFLQGPLLRSSALFGNFGVVLALSANPLELIVASDIHVRFLQTSEEPRLIFQVSERVALRVKESAAIAVLI